MSLQVLDRGQESRRVVPEHAKARIALPAKGVADGARCMAVIHRQSLCGTAYRTGGSEVRICNSVQAQLITDAIAVPAIRVPAGHPSRELVVGLEGVALGTSASNLAAGHTHPAAHSRFTRVKVGGPATGANPFSPLGFPNAFLAPAARPAATGVVKLVQRLRLLAQGTLSNVVHNSKYKGLTNLHLGGG